MLRIIAESTTRDPDGKYHIWLGPRYLWNGSQELPGVFPFQAFSHWPHPTRHPSANPLSGIESKLANPPDHHGVLFQLFSQQNHESRETAKPNPEEQPAKFTFFV
jgi:hypothetical protein